MNKNQGATIAAIVLAGLLLRPVGPTSSQRTDVATGSANLSGLSQQQETKTEGPWIASCKYWASSRDVEKPDGEQPSGKSPELHSNVEQTNGKINWQLNITAGKEELGCGSERYQRWGFPESSTSVRVQAVIATVPDPVHTHLALSFDRTVDALLQAAGDNHYVSSYYWVPWRSREGKLRAADSSGDAEPGHDPERERQPGLIVLKHVPETENGEKANLDSSLYGVIYVFLVAETPTQGVEGFQLLKALSYEDDIETNLKRLGGQFARGRDDHHIAVIGPVYTGSAPSLRAGAETEARKRQINGVAFDITGTTATSLAAEVLNTPQIRYFSFDQNPKYEQDTFLERLKLSGYKPCKIALLVEDNTALSDAIGNAVANTAPAQNQDPCGKILTIRFPREISLLRNAQASGDQGGAEAVSSGSVPSPYLHFSLKDFSAGDSVPQFSRENTPLSQEAQLMTIGRQLRRYRSQFIAIVASNRLDEIFLAQFLHRACPDATLAFFGGDLLMVREIDNVPFIGSLELTPYPLLGMGQGSNTTGPASRTYSDSESVAYYNAASYTLWNICKTCSVKPPRLKSYGHLFDLDKMQPTLWATVIGTDGYYPLAIISPCASDTAAILPTLDATGQPTEKPCIVSGSQQPSIPKKTLTIYPALLWVVLNVFVMLFCVAHIVILCVADYWSPFTRDLAIQDNVEPRRRSMYAHVGAAMLWSMAFVIACPLLSLSRAVTIDTFSIVVSCITLAVGALAVTITFWQTKSNIRWVKDPGGPLEERPVLQVSYLGIVRNIYLFINCLAWLTLVAIPIVWVHLCSESSGELKFVGLSFSYRCIYPESGVSPVLPVLLLLFGWYLWAFYQTRRLRFSKDERPCLPKRLSNEGDNRFFVSDEDLDGCKSPRQSALYANMTCLLVTRRIILRFLGLQGSADASGVDVVLFTAYAGALVCFAFFTPILSLDHFLGSLGDLSNRFELVVKVLSFPLIMVALAGWLRMILIWGSLRRGLLQRLENQPIRFALSRLKSVGWMTMLRQGGLHGQWRDIERSIESMRQMLHDGQTKAGVNPSVLAELESVDGEALATYGQLRTSMDPDAVSSRRSKHSWELMKELEVKLALFSKLLLSGVLIPYWQTERTGLVDTEEIDQLPIRAGGWDMHGWLRRLPVDLHATPTSTGPAHITLAEEFVAIRYVALIRAVLANMQYLAIFVSVSFVLAIVAWNSYPFQPRQWVDWLFTGLLLFLGSGVVWVFAQVYRDPLLSRITNTKANELGWEFYVRVFSFGAVPVVTWLAYQFPAFGSVIFKVLQPGVDVMK